MKTNKLYWKIILDQIKNGEKPDVVELDFNNEKILWKDAMILGEYGIEVPDQFIDYDDENIDYSDIPAITDKDIEDGKIKWIYKAEIPLRKEIEEWIKKEKIDVDSLISDLIENFYNTMKIINKNESI